LAKLLAASGLPQSGENGHLTHEDEKLLLLSIWDDLDTDDKIAVMRILRAMVRRAPHQSQSPRRI